MTQNDRLLASLRNGPIDPLTAMTVLGIYRLGARVYDLKRRGHTITTERVEIVNRLGQTCRVARYTLAS